MDIFLIRSSGQYFEKFSHQTLFSWLCLTRFEFHAILKIPEKVRCDFYCKQQKLIQSGSLDLNCRGLKLLWHVIHWNHMEALSIRYIHSFSFRSTKARTFLRWTFTMFTYVQLYRISSEEKIIIVCWLCNCVYNANQKGGIFCAKINIHFALSMC